MYTHTHTWLCYSIYVIIGFTMIIRTSMNW